LRYCYRLINMSLKSHYVSGDWACFRMLGRHSLPRNPSSATPSSRFRLTPPHHGAELRRPAGPLLLGRALERERACRHVFGDDAARSDVGAVPDLDRGNERGVGADEGAGADHGAMLVEAVVVAEDCAGPDVGAAADVTIADVGKVIGLGALAQRRILDLDEIADVHARPQIGTRPQPRERPDPRTRPDVRMLDVAIGFDLGAVLHAHARPEEHVRLDDDVAGERG